MTSPEQTQEQSDKEKNFRLFEQKMQRQIAEVESQRDKLAEELKMRQAQPQPQDEDDSDEPYVDHKKLKRTLQNQSQVTQSEIQKAMETAKHAAKEELKQELWLERHEDFQETMQYAEKLAKANPQLADTILKMPNTFERQQLVYANIKALGLDKPESKPPSIQDKIDANRKPQYYQPSGVSAAPYSHVGDFSATGQKAAYDKMQQLKNTLRL